MQDVTSRREIQEESKQVRNFNSEQNKSRVGQGPVGTAEGTVCPEDLRDSQRGGQGPVRQERH